MRLLKFSPLILALLANRDANSQEKTRLLPIKWSGEINSVSHAWKYGKFLGDQTILTIRGPFSGELKAVSGNDTIPAHLEYGDLDKVIDLIRNKELSREQAREDLSGYELLRKDPNIFEDGKVTSEEELRFLNELKDRNYIVPFFYVSSDRKASLPGIFLIEKQGDNFKYIEFKDREKSGDSSRVKAQALGDTTKARAKSLEESAQYKPQVALEDTAGVKTQALEGDTTKTGVKSLEDTAGVKTQALEGDTTKALSESDYLKHLQATTPSELYKGRIDSLKFKLVTLKDLEKRLSKKDSLDVSDKKELKVIKEEQEKITTGLDSLDQIIRQYGAYAFDLGFGYEFNKNKYNGNVTARLNLGNWILGAEVAYGERSSRNPDRIVRTAPNQITGFYGEGSERISERGLDVYYGGEFGYNSGLISLIGNAGVEVNNLTMTREVKEYLKDNLNRVVARNGDTYSTNDKVKRFRPGIGIDLNLGKIKLGGRIIKHGKDYSGGAKVFYNF